MTKEQIAQVAHEVNKAYCQAIGDYSQVDWAEAPQWQRDSAISGVNFHLENPDKGPEDSHAEWKRHKMAEGWSYGETKDVFKKQHPCMCDYKDLPVEQKAKDYFFRQLVHSLKKFL